MKLIAAGVVSVAIALSLVACDGGSRYKSGSNTPASATQAASSIPTAASTSKTVSSATTSLDLSGESSGVPITMKAAPANAIKSPGPGGRGVNVIADLVVTNVTTNSGSLAQAQQSNVSGVVMNVTTDSRTLAQAKQSIISGAEGATFVRFLVDESDALVYEATEGGGAHTFLVFVAPAATPGYVCVSATLALSKNANGKVYSEAVARQMLDACRSLVKQ